MGDHFLGLAFWFIWFGILIVGVFGMRGVPVESRWGWGGVFGLTWVELGILGYILLRKILAE